MKKFMSIMLGLSLVLGAITKEWAKDVYRALRKSKPAAE